MSIIGNQQVLDKVGMHARLCNQLNTMYAEKNVAYGDSFHKTFLEEGFMTARIRMTDKLNRFKNLTKPGEDLAVDIHEESIEDTLMDLANYALMTVMEIRLSKDT